jgi:hypothetical protein
VPKPARSRKSTKLSKAEVTIHVIRGEQVLLDTDLATVYGVTTSALNQAVKRNPGRFPKGFRFRLTEKEVADLRSQSVIPSSGHGGRRTPPWAFTEHGAIMAAAVLNSPRAVEMSVYVVRAFVRLRDTARTHAELAKQLAALERRVTAHDEDLKDVFAALRHLLEPPDPPRRAIGFGEGEEE